MKTSNSSASYAVNPSTTTSAPAGSSTTTPNPQASPVAPSPPPQADPVSTNAAAETAYGEAYARRLPEITALTADDLVAVNIDLRAAVAAVLGALPHILPLREQMVGLAGFDMASLDNLEDYAGAVGHAHSKYLGAAPDAADLAADTERAMDIRDTLRADVGALVHRGLIDPKRLERFKGLNGYKNVSFDVMGIADLLLECWPKVGGKTAATLDDIHEAKQVGERIIAAFGVREQTGPAVSDAALNRQRAFSLLSHAYDQVRRAVAFVRWNEDDADDIAPSLFAGRNAKPRSDKPQPQPAPDANKPTGNGAPTGTTAPSQSPAPSPSTSTSTNVPTPPVATHPATPVDTHPAAPVATAPAAPIGFPGSNPFTS